ncbi:LCP family protein [Curtobacterium aurantiacum]|uniref:LCP family protein n=1 Tax=Curtobacterium aurantiacum TaxID=3236919 RepID=A0ABS5VFA3_9MICO|nr:LCP family protein [Curtobacterium flaccumfaciens]MBT1544636.1 LCP family protein [Curtobacterium flaccumfaciens pv. flaccumfaciens]MBT1587601.1 LCP family protein [Curtobacterium flaccumfaciens pv. flaccumfaciens]MBT1677463.1 LCP family protein [Curtobacterium flaccumfaciens pv. flaccumfaciens]
MSERRAARAAAAHTLRATGRSTRRRRPFLVALVATLGSLVGVALVIAVVASVFVSGLARSFDAGRDTITDPFPSGARPSTTSGENILLIGSDTRAQGGPEGARPELGGRSDTLMLAHVPADRQHVYLMSIMRDSWVEVPGHGRAKINAAYSWGGVALTTETVEQLLDIRIDHVAEIDFAGFEGMTDALGGVTVDSPRAFSARGHDVTAGANRLDGAAALAFVRERYAFADADHTRVRNQQAFMRGVVDGLLSRGTVTNPGRIQDFVAATSEHLSVDAGFSFARMVELGWSLRAVRADDLVTFTVPTAGSGTSPDGQSVVTLNELAVGSLSQALRSDDVAGWLADNPQ